MMRALEILLLVLIIAALTAIVYITYENSEAFHPEQAQRLRFLHFGF